jgi:small subunit ribosomal protein S3
MGQKVHPFGFRLGIIKDWQAKWFDEKHYAELVQEDIAIRQLVQSKYVRAGVSQVEIERGSNQVTVTIHTSRPGVVIGRSGQRVDELRNELQRVTGKKFRLNIQEIRDPELDAHLVAKDISGQLERRISPRRAVKRAIARTMECGAKGIKVVVSGRLGGAEIARRASEHEGSVPLHTLRADIDYGFAEALTPKGLIGVKVWIYKGDILPEVKEAEAEVPLPAEAATEMPLPAEAATEMPLPAEAAQE